MRMRYAKDGGTRGIKGTVEEMGNSDQSGHSRRYRWGHVSRVLLIGPMIGYC